MNTRAPFATLLSVLVLTANATVTGRSASSNGDAFRPAKAEFEEFRPAVNWILRHAPKEWAQLKFTYAYYDQLGVMHAYSKSGESDTWAVISHSDFEMHAFFDTYRARTHPNMAKPWTAVIVIVSKASATFNASFCYAIPRPNDVKLDTDKMRC